MRASLSLFFLFLFCLSPLLACQSESPGEEPEGSESAAQPVAEEEEDRSHLLAYGGPIELTIDDLTTLVERSRLFSQRDDQGRLPQEEATWMAMPQAQVSMVRSLIQMEIYRYAAQERELTASEEEILRAITEDSRLYVYSPLLLSDSEEREESHLYLLSELESLGLSLEDIRTIGKEMVLQEKLKDLLAEEFPEETLRAIYNESNNEIDLVVVQFNNSPTSEEIDSAIQALDSSIRARYREQRERYFIPGQTVNTVLRIPDFQAEERSPRVLSEAFTRLQGGEDLVDIARELDLEIRENLIVSALENREAYHAEPGQVGIARRSRQGPYVWRLEKRITGERRPLDRPLRREIASELLRESGILPSRQEQANQAREIFSRFQSDKPLSEQEVEALLAALTEAGFRAHQTDFFSLRTQPPIPGIGLAENFYEEVQTLTWDEPIAGPALDRDLVILGLMVGRTFPDQEGYERDRADFRESFLESNRERLLDQFAMDFQRNREIKINMSVVHNHYGQATKKE